MTVPVRVLALTMVGEAAAQFDRMKAEVPGLVNEQGRIEKAK